MIRGRESENMVVVPLTLGEIFNNDWPLFAQALFHERSACRLLGIDADEIFQEQFIVEKQNYFSRES